MSRSLVNPAAFGISPNAIQNGLNTLQVGDRPYNVMRSIYPTTRSGISVRRLLGPARKFSSGLADRYSATHLQVAGSRPCSQLLVWSPHATPPGTTTPIFTCGYYAASSAGAYIGFSASSVSAAAFNSSSVEVSVAGPAPSVGKQYVSVLTAGDYLRLYHDGAMVGETALSGGGARTTADSKLIDIGRYTDINVYLAAEFTKELPQAYAFSLAKDPWQILVPPVREKIFVFGSQVESGGVSASGSLPTVSISAPDGSATGAATASGDIQALSLSPETGTASGNASAAGSLQALSLTTPEGSATGASAASAGIQALSISAPSGDATGSCSTSGEVPAVSLSAPTGTASSGAGTVADGALAAVGLTVPSGSATGMASAAGGIIGLSLSAPAGNASGAASCSGAFHAVSITACNGTATGTSPASRASAAPVFCRIVRPVTTVRLASNSHVVRVPDGH